MEFILQLIADLFLPDDVVNQQAQQRHVNSEEVTEVSALEEEVGETANIFSLMDFH